MFEAWKTGWRGIIFTFIMLKAYEGLVYLLHLRLPEYWANLAIIACFVLLGPCLAHWLQFWIYPNPDYDFHVGKEDYMDRWLKGSIFSSPRKSGRPSRESKAD